MMSTISIDAEQAEKFKAIGITLLENYNGYKNKILMKCNTCGHECLATPQSRIQSHKKYQTNGCPKCLDVKKYQSQRNEVLRNLEERNISVLSPYNGNQSTTELITVRNNNCGHEFDITPTNLIHNGVDCSICGTQTRINQLQQSNKWSS